MLRSLGCRARAAYVHALPLSLHQAEPGQSPDGNPDGHSGSVRACPEPGARMAGSRHWREQARARANACAIERVRERARARVSVVAATAAHSQRKRSTKLLDHK